MTKKDPTPDPGNAPPEKWTGEEVDDEELVQALVADVGDGERDRES